MEWMVSAMDRDAKKLEGQVACARFEELLAAMLTRELAEDEWTFYLEHEELCEANHSASKLEEELHVKPGALEAGDASRGLMSARELGKQTLKLIQFLRAQDEEPPAPANCLFSSLGTGKSSLIHSAQRWMSWSACGAPQPHKIEHSMAPLSPWLSMKEGESRCLTEGVALLVIWDRMPRAQEIPALRRLLDLSITEFWMMLIAYQHSSESSTHRSSQRRQLEDWDVLFWRDASASSGVHWPEVNSERLFLKNLRDHLAHWCNLSGPSSWRRAVGIVVPTEGGASKPLASSDSPREKPLDAKKYAKGREAQVVRLDELLDHLGKTPLLDGANLK
jgi:hypothetical protein